MKHKFRMFYGNSMVSIPIEISDKNMFDETTINRVDPYIYDKLKEMLDSKQVVSCCIELHDCRTLPVKIYSHSSIRQFLDFKNIPNSIYELISDYLYTTIEYNYYFNVGKIINRKTKKVCSIEEIKQNIPRLDESFEFCKYVKLRVNNIYHKFVEDNGMLSNISDRGGD